MRAQWFGGMHSPEEGHLTDTQRDTHLPSSPLCPCELPDLSRYNSVLPGKGERLGTVDLCFDYCQALLGNKGYVQSATPPPTGPQLSQRCP